MKYEITTKKYVLTESGTTLIIPISFFDDVIRTELPEQFLAAEKETLRLLSAELPSEEKIKAAVREFLPYASGAGYQFDRIVHQHRFVCTSRTMINENCILRGTGRGDSVEITQDFGRFNIVRKTWPGDDYPYRGTGVVIDGKLVSYCIENSHYHDSYDETEIGVQTHEAYRRRGYASSCAALLCSLLLAGQTAKIYYNCSADNEASFRTALRAGLDHECETYYLIFDCEKK
ncbi:MAG TPA: GNAT family N-acetyltransferase [Clostridiales bacterium]|jgi:hypothetical protein|nr:GNAT family N-acetyltransferase [Clostridiales bacterium]